MKHIVLFAVVIGAVLFLYRSCTKGYDNYAYVVKVNDETIFSDDLSENDNRIIAHGRQLKTDVVRMDNELDNANGPRQGIVRWYNCMGIDCDEGWQRSFKTRN